MSKETFDFSEALRRMKEGKKVRRVIWEECGAYIHIVSETILRINHRLTVDNCAVRGYDSVYVPMRYADEIASDCILKVLDKAKNEATQDV